MHTPAVRHTLAIFEHLVRQPPPLVPQAILDDAVAALEQLRYNYDLTLDELEQTMITFGKRLWPYRKAFQEFVDVYEGKMGEKLFLQHVGPALRTRYKAFVAHGGDFRDLHAGGPLGFFTPEERLLLCEALVETRANVRSHTAQAVVSTDQREYELRIVEFDEILQDIEKRLDTLRRTAEDEQEHPELAGEIRAQVRGFEHGLCGLDQQTDHFAVCNASEFFVERKHEKHHHTQVYHTGAVR